MIMSKVDVLIMFLSFCLFQLSCKKCWCANSLLWFRWVVSSEIRYWNMNINILKTLSSRKYLSILYQKITILTSSPRWCRLIVCFVSPTLWIWRRFGLKWNGSNTETAANHHNWEGNQLYSEYLLGFCTTMTWRTNPFC